MMIGMGIPISHISIAGMTWKPSDIFRQTNVFPRPAQCETAFEVHPSFGGSKQASARQDQAGTTRFNTLCWSMVRGPSGSLLARSRAVAFDFQAIRVRAS